MLLGGFDYEVCAHGMHDSGMSDERAVRTQPVSWWMRTAPWAHAPCDSERRGS